ncbi:MAG TPA: Na+/H+ antiporter NhaA [Gemmatimonadaceae bacterium]|nr:Na+/H+ antiporter NhaA [Gemmatimonadaceae bacterium]
MTAPIVPRSSTSPEPMLVRVLRPFQQFTHTEAAGGIVLLACAAVALVWANSPWAASYFHLWEATIGIRVGERALDLSLHHWINDGLMAVFFFVVGLEIKREMLVGELSTPRQAALPIAGALGGMIVPAVIYATFNVGGPGAPGWGIPMATDIAFALGVLALLGPRVPVVLKVFLTALAIADDIGAVLVIALFYTSELAFYWLLVGGGVLAALIGLNVLGVRRPAAYLVLGALLWLAFLKSGVHATVAGVVLAMTIPSRTRVHEEEFLQVARGAIDEFDAACQPGETVLTNRAQQEAVEALEHVSEAVQSPLFTMERKLHGVVAFFIMPVFALANAGVALGGLLDSLSLAVTSGVMLGLVLGKPIGITLFSWLAVRMGLATLPAQTSWRALHGVSWLGGIGFTMSLFIAGLAFADATLLDSAKVGILGASVVAGLAGWLMLKSAMSMKGE